MDDLLFIDKLRGAENWATWKFQMEHLLKASGLWALLTETETLAEDANAEERKEFTKRREKAFAMLVLNLSPPQLYLITSCQTPKEAWTALKAHFERDALAIRRLLKRRYLRCEMKEGARITEHLEWLKELTDQLAAVGAVVEEEDQIVTLWGSLPPTYAKIVTTAVKTKPDDLTLQFVQQELIREEQRRDSFSLSGGGARRIRGGAGRRPQEKPGINPPRRRRPEPKMVFYRCDTKGHDARWCWCAEEVCCRSDTHADATCTRRDGGTKR